MPKSMFKEENFEDVGYTVFEKDKKKIKKLSAKDQARLLNQIRKEYDVAFGDTESKRAMWLTRLRLYNNQKRDAENVGEPLMFTIFNSILAALWDDRLMVNWEGRGGQGDEDVEENLNALSSFDYDIMKKTQIDYEWDWDTAFFGRGLVLMLDFIRDKDKQCPAPEVIDPTGFIRDPNAKSVNGDMVGRGAMRFGGYEVGMSYYEMEDHPGYFNLSFLKKGKNYQSLLGKSKTDRGDAQGRTNFDPKEEALNKRENYEYTLLRWFTIFKGDKVMVELGNDKELVVRFYKLDDYWPLIDRTLYPVSHDWDGVTIPDLTEDKQRAKAILMNLGLKSAKADVLPKYLYDAQRITNRKDLNDKFNKFIPVQGRIDNAISPVQKSVFHQHVGQVLEILDTAAQKATATPEIQQGINSSDKRTATELNLVSSKVDTRYSMSAKLFGLSEANFWRHWYLLYKKHFKGGIDEKIIRLQGVFSPVWRSLTRENIIAMVDPDVRIESRVISEAKRDKERNAYERYAGIIIADPTVNRRHVFKKLGKFNNMKKEEIDATFPQTVDEIQAEDENILLNKEKLPKISIMDDHQTHLEIHAKANLSPTLIAHVKKHKELMIEVKKRIDLFGGQQQVGQGPTPTQQTSTPPTQQTSTPPSTTPTQ